VFEYCLPYQHDAAHWRTLAPINIQINMTALTRYCVAYAPAMEKLAKVARHKILTDMATRKPVVADGMTLQSDDFDTWLNDARALIENHLVIVGEAPEAWRDKNLDLMRKLYDGGCMHIATARSNGRVFGYLMTIIGPSLTREGKVTAYNGTFYAADEVPGLGMKLQRYALNALKEKGVDEVLYEAGNRGSGPRLGTLYRRLGAQEHGRVFRLPLTEAA
jgi:hypothetical protein